MPKILDDASAVVKIVNSVLVWVVTEISSLDFKNRIGSAAVDIITRRTKTGGGVTKSNKRSAKLAPLKPSTVDRRSRQDLAPDTSPKTTNQTQSGEMLNSLKHKPTRTGSEIYFNGSKMQERAQRQSDRTKVKPARHIMDLTTKEESKIAEEISKRLVLSLSKLRF